MGVQRWTTVALLLSSIWLAIVLLLIARAIRQQPHFRQLLPIPSSVALDMPKIAVVVPARNEASNVAACLQSLIRQDYPEKRLQLVLVDDQSTDATNTIARAFASKVAHLAVVDAPSLPAGWTGKAHACWIGATRVSADVEWLCFLDADMRPAPALLASAIYAAIIDGMDLLSLTPHHALESFAERLMLPCGMYLLSFTQNLEHAQAHGSDDATVAGQFMLIRRRAYDAVGGHAAIRAAICEDLELARALKRAGFEVQLRACDRMLSGRMYTGWGTLWPGLAKNVVETFGGRTRTTVIAIVAVALSGITLLLPLAEGIGCIDGHGNTCAATLVAGIGSLTVVAFHVAGAIRFNIPIWYGLAFPLGYCIGAVLAFDGILRQMTGRVRWKDRIYP
jgi:chlorobactene glucosyltransferase